MKKTKFLPLILAVLIFLSACTAAEPPMSSVQVPVTEEPVMEEPVTEEPIIEEAIAEEPIVEEPIVEEAPTPAPQPQCTVSVSCAVLLENMSLLPEEKQTLVPADGILLPPTAVALTGGESVFDVALSAVRESKLHMEYTKGITSYIEGVCNLYEFDAGPASGWTYSINGVFPNLDSGACLVQDGDIVELVYSLAPKTGE